MSSSRATPKPQAMARGVACLMLLAISGCAIPGLRRAAPGPVLPPDFNGAVSSENSAQVGIYEFFDDPVLTQLIAQGLMSNQELRIRNQEIQIASNEIMARRGAYLPFITGGLGGGFDRTSRFSPLGAAEDQLTAPGGIGFPDPLTNMGLSADLFWRIDIWRELRNSRDAAIQRYVAAVEARNYLITKIVAEIAENYYELAALDKRLVYLNQTIELQRQSLEFARANKEAGKDTELPVQRFLAEVRKNESQRLIVNQRIIEVENRINFLAGRYPQRVGRQSWDFIRLDSRILSVGVPAQLLLNRRDIRAAERELAASGLDILVARARFFPRLDITAGIGFESFNPKYLFDPGAFIARAAGDLVAPLINKSAIRADYLNANARQLQAVYNYQRTVLNAFTQVVNSLAKVENYRRSVAIKRLQVRALEESVSVATDLFQAAQAEYVDVLFSQRDLLEARIVLIETKQQQLSAIVNAYQALGGGYLLNSAGMQSAELLCWPPNTQVGEFQDGELVSPPPPGDETESPAPGEESMPLPPPGGAAPGYDEPPPPPPGAAAPGDQGPPPPPPGAAARLPIIRDASAPPAQNDAGPPYAYSSQRPR